jgi:large subunit ribosomal protein L22
VTAPRQDVQAVAKTVHVSARKARLVVDQIRGRSVPEARTILAFSTRAAARDVEKVLRSAVANAEMNPARQWNGDDLYVKAAFVDEGVTIKRWRARARGRVNRIFKRTCHITIKLDKLEETPQKPKRGAQKQTRARKGGTAGGATASKPKTRKKKEVSA